MIDTRCAEHNIWDCVYCAEDPTPAATQSGFDYVDYLHCFADDAHGCTPSAAKTVHACADEIERLQRRLVEAEQREQRALAEAETARRLEAETDAACRAAIKLRDQAREALQRVEQLCASFDPTSGSGRARAFVGDLRAVVRSGAGSLNNPNEKASG